MPVKLQVGGRIDPVHYRDPKFSMPDLVLKQLESEIYNVSLNESFNSPTRRKIVKGAAWSVPVIAAAIAAPAASASVVAPVRERFDFQGSTSSSTIGGVVQAIKLTGGNFELEGPVGASTGEITLVAEFPTGYDTWQPIGDLWGWTWSEKVDAEGVRIVTFIHAGVNITTVGAKEHVWFAGIQVNGAGASKRNRALFAFSSDNFTGGGLFAPN